MTSLDIPASQITKVLAEQPAMNSLVFLKVNYPS
jgi:hypothetical protein